MIFSKLKNSSFLFLASCFLSLASSQAQSLLFPTDYLFSVQSQKADLTDTTSIIHSSLQPFIFREIPPDTFKKLIAGDDPFFDKVFYENLLQLRHIDNSSGYPRKFNIDVNPILNFSYSKDLSDTTNATLTTNTRGFWVRGELGQKLIFESAFMENQSTFPTYLKDYSTVSGVVPGQGRWKVFKKDGFDYAMASAILHYQQGKNFSIRLGHGKQKIGNGYRSLLLSDNAFNYPYAQLTASFLKQKLQYSQTYAVLMNLTDGGTKIPPGIERIYQKKAASFQHLSWHTSKYLDIYFFQGMIWQATDTNNEMHLNGYYANPVIFTNLGKYGFNNANHILTGGGFEIHPFKKTSLYAQFMYDGVDKDGKPNYGYQAGLKLFDVLGLKNLFLQYEFNYVSRYSYQNSKYSTQDYTHYNQTLTTPSLFPMEHIGMISYTYKRVFIQLKENYSNGEFSGVKQSVNYFDAKIGYMINPHYNFTIAMGTTLRTYLDEFVSSKSQQMQLFYVSLRTSLYNLYYDF